MVFKETIYRYNSNKDGEPKPGKTEYKDQEKLGKNIANISYVF